MANYSTNTNFKGLSTQTVTGSLDAGSPTIAQFDIDAEIVRITDHAVLQLPYVSLLPSNGAFFLAWWSSSSTAFSLTFSAPPAFTDQYGNAVAGMSINGISNSNPALPTTLSYSTEAGEVNKPQFFLIAGNNNHYSIKQIFEGADNVRKIDGLLKQFKSTRFFIKRNYLIGPSQYGFPPIDQVEPTDAWAFRPMHIRIPDLGMSLKNVDNFLYGTQKHGNSLISLKSDWNAAGKKTSLARSLEATVPDLVAYNPGLHLLRSSTQGHTVPANWIDKHGVVWGSGASVSSTKIVGDDDKNITLNPIQLRQDPSYSADDGVIMQGGTSRQFTDATSVSSSDKKTFNVFFTLNDKLTAVGAEWSATKRSVKMEGLYEFVAPMTSWAYNINDYSNNANTNSADPHSVYQCSNAFGGVPYAVELCSVEVTPELTTKLDANDNIYATKYSDYSVGEQSTGVKVHHSSPLALDQKPWTATDLLTGTNGYWPGNEVYRSYANAGGNPAGYLKYYRAHTLIKYDFEMEGNRAYFLNLRTSDKNVDWQGNSGDNLPSWKVSGVPIDSPFICCFTPNDDGSDNANYGPFSEHVEIVFRGLNE